MIEPADAPDPSSLGSEPGTLSADEAEHSLEGSVFLLAGAGGGIGRVVAATLARQGVRLVCVDAPGGGAEEVADEVTTAGGEAVAIEGDVTEQAEVEVVATEALRRWGTLSGLVNCVGITGRTGVRSHEVDVEDLRRVVEVNLMGAFLLSRAVLPHLVAARYGRILHVASIAGKEGNAGMVSYSASKAGLIGMVKSMGKEYARDGITVNAIAPAVIWTPMVEAMPSDQVEYMTERIPMGRLGDLQEVADMVAWVVSPAASFTTGFTFDLTGGRATY